MCDAKITQYHEIVKFFPPQKWGDFSLELGTVHNNKLDVKIKKPER